SNPIIPEQAKENQASLGEGIIEGPFGFKYHVLDGVNMMPIITPERYELSRTIKTRDTDICFTSYP
ncbi:hypothetical protein GGI12_006248, partial [Dipsacomyces acuminosporus]